MFDEMMNDPEADESVAVDPPNNTEEGSLMSPMDDNSIPIPVDPPNNT